MNILTTEQAETLHAARTVLRSLDATIFEATRVAVSPMAGADLGHFREAVAHAESGWRSLPARTSRGAARRAPTSRPARSRKWQGSPHVDKFRYLVVEGPIGAGKTSLARRLASRLAADLVLEQPEENPFLARFYQDMARFALPTQLFFLFQRARLLEPLAQPDMFGRPVIGDFLLDKDPLFARITLSADELALYQKIYEALRPRSPAPDLVLYLQAQPATLIEKSSVLSGNRCRAAGGWSTADRSSLAYNAAPVLIVNSDNLNFVEREADFELLVSRLRGMRSRREFFNLG